MLTVNLLPWRDGVNAKRKRFFKIMTLLTFITAFLMYLLVYQHFKVELKKLEGGLIVLTKNLEKYTYSSNHNLVELSKIVNNIHRNQDQLKKLFHAMFIHSRIKWNSIEIQKGFIKIYGVSYLMNYLSSFVGYCEKQFGFKIFIKDIKFIPPFESIQFQIQVDRMD